MLLFGAAVRPAASAPLHERAEYVMGTVARIAMLGDVGDPAAFEAGFGAIRAVDRSMSLYRPESELLRVNAHAAWHAEPVGADLFRLLVRAGELSVVSDGAFDVTVLPLLRAWGGYRELAHLGVFDPSAVGYAALRLDREAASVRFELPGMALDLGGIAKGYALDRAREALRDRGVRRARLDLGGNLALLGTGPSGQWTVAVRDPAQPTRALGILTLPADYAVATSANYARDFATEGWRAPSHVYDPRTRRPVLDHGAVTVWAPDATTADALATALLVTGSQGADDVLARTPGVGALFADEHGGRVTIHGMRPPDWAPMAHSDDDGRAPRRACGEGGR